MFISNFKNMKSQHTNEFFDRGIKSEVQRIEGYKEHFII